MATLNKRASEIMLEAGVNTATDITGFGLIGHLSEVLIASRCSARLYASSVPFFKEAITLADMGMVPGGTRANLKNYESIVEWASGVSNTERFLMNDAQTSGGLLLFVSKGNKKRLVSALLKDNIMAAEIGALVDTAPIGDKRIFVEK